MLFGPDLDESRATRRRLSDAGAGLLRMTLLFGSVAVALALILAPIADRRAKTVIASAGNPFGIDRTVTGSVGAAKRYTIHRSVLQSSPTAVCIIQSNGDRRGDC